MAIPSKSRAKEGARVTVNFSDSIDLIREQIQWSPKGVCLLTKWPFEVGKEVEFAFDHRGERHCCTGVVVSCHPLRQQPGCFEVVLYFVETPCTKLQKAACDCRLAREEQIRQEEARYVNTLHGSTRFAPKSRTRARVE
jgi:hypothetical protein